MEVLYRNFFSLARQGAFDADEILEPMSAFKWRKLRRLATSQGLIGYAATAIGRIPGDELDRLGLGIDAPHLWQKAAHDYLSGSSEEEFPPSYRLERQYQSIRSASLDGDNPSPETIEMLGLVVSNALRLIDRDMDLGSLVDMGRYLRMRGRYVDDALLAGWVASLHLQRIADFQSSILISLFGFSQDEFPTLIRLDNRARETVIAALERTLAHPRRRPIDNEDEDSDLLGSYLMFNVDTFTRNIALARRYMAYAPIETAYIFLRHLSNGLSGNDE